MNVWLIGATVLMSGLGPCLWVALRDTPEDGLVALQIGTSAATLVLVLLAEGFHRSSYFALPLVLSVLSFVGALVYARFLGKPPLR